MIKQYGRSSVIASILTLFFCAIMFYILLEIFFVTSKPGGAICIMFSVLNCAILFGLALCGNTIARITTAATLIQLWFVTAIYTVLQFGSVFIGVATWYGSFYVLYQLVLMFIYLCIALPVLNISYKKNNIQSKEN